MGKNYEELYSKVIRMALEATRLTLTHLVALRQKMPVSYALAFVEIALEPDLSLGDLAKRLHMPVSTVSRIVSALSCKNRYGLVIIRNMPADRRRKCINLTLSGQKAANLL